MNWSERDKKHIWHPFTHLKTAVDPIRITKAEGLYLYDDKGSKIMDAISSWWVNLHGHSHPYISKKVSEQLFSFEHIPFADFTHQPAIELAERLLGHLPNNQSKIFYSDNGSTAVEVALKMTLQYWHNKGEPKNTFIALENAYHGDTFGGMSVGARNVFNSAFENQLFNVAHIPIPTKENLEQIKEVIGQWKENHSIAGFIFEPLVQGAAGMMMYDGETLDELIAFCKQNEIITIADEVMTGFGRTGKFFATDHLNNKPDIIGLSKGLTGGYLPLGVTSCAQFIYDAYISDDKTKTFFHGHSYTANATACAAALASLDLMEKRETLDQIQMIEKEHLSFLNEIKDHKACKDIRVKGTILAIELKTEGETHYLNTISEKINSYFLNKGILLRPLGNVFYVLPPYCITKDELQYIYKNIKEFLNL
ncbi:MAG: adenosylmethionine--8-amino-7-oxononanoate transaminase [Bacteroidia bacterium]|nr:adenosylmethionine--8-amino-7-oxononanoate transaminase [Sphingobacteriaceae bacterium]MBP9068802.1 adenosylmethionine--8-amino-7-oxononanoate transaminase [Bacteroidia bacterium]